MISTKFLSVSALMFAAASAIAQNCSMDVYPVQLMNAQGTLAPLTSQSGSPVAQFATELVYMAFHPNTPSGTYYVHVINPPTGIMDTMLSANDPMDRFVSVTNTNGVISLSLPYTNNPDPTVFGAAPGGSQSLRITPVLPSPTEPCIYKVIMSDLFDLTLPGGSNSPYHVKGGFNPITQQCAVASTHLFRIGDGTGSDVRGTLFLDGDRDGVRDVGEGPLANWQVQLVTGQVTLSATTDAAGAYVFADVLAANYTVELQMQPGYIATTVPTQTFEVCGCADVNASSFGVAPQLLACDGHTIGYWRNQNGLARVQQYGILATLPALHLRNLCGQQVAPGSLCSFRNYLKCANSWNMAYMLSAQLVAMHCNVITGFVDPACVIQDAHLGNITIADLMQQAILSLGLHGFTPPCSQHRQAQERLKNALDNANNNRNWL